MIKVKYFSPNNDFKTGILCKLSFFSGLILLLVFIVLKISAFFIGENSSGYVKKIYDFAQTGQSESILAFSILLLAAGVILLFFHCQFNKLAEIADEIENSEEYEEIN